MIVTGSRKIVVNAKRETVSVLDGVADTRGMSYGAAAARHRDVQLTWNPSEGDLHHLASRHGGHVRGMAYGNDFVAWPSHAAVHEQVAQSLGMKGGEYYKSRTEIVPHAELNNPEKYDRDRERHDTNGPFVMYSPDYGVGLNHPHLQSLKLKEAKGSYDGGQVKIRESQ